MEPGRSSGSSLGFFSTGDPAKIASLAVGMGELRFTVPIAVDPIVVDVLFVDAVDGEVDVGFFKPFRDGGGGASSMRPWERNCEL